MTAGATEANGGHALEHAMSDVDLGFANDALPVASSPGGSMHGAKCAGFGRELYGRVVLSRSSYHTGICCRQCWSSKHRVKCALAGGSGPGFPSQGLDMRQATCSRQAFMSASSALSRRETREPARFAASI